MENKNNNGGTFKKTIVVSAHDRSNTKGGVGAYTRVQTDRKTEEEKLDLAVAHVDEVKKARELKVPLSNLLGLVPKKPGRKGPLSAEHKAKLKEGRNQYFLDMTKVRKADAIKALLNKKTGSCPECGQGWGQKINQGRVSPYDPDLIYCTRACTKCKHIFQSHELTSMAAKNILNEARKEAQILITEETPSVQTQVEQIDKVIDLMLVPDLKESTPKEKRKRTRLTGEKLMERQLSVQQMIRDGKSIQEIADFWGYSTNSVYKDLQELNEPELYNKLAANTVAERQKNRDLAKQKFVEQEIATQKKEELIDDEDAQLRMLAEDHDAAIASRARKILKSKILEKLENKYCK